jgi:hypothetical protein
VAVGYTPPDGEPFLPPTSAFYSRVGLSPLGTHGPSVTKTSLALLLEIGLDIEAARLPIAKDLVFS